ncbi:ABC-three component system protein [Methylotenera sp.]|uniref:ABC-three component system protein n=1 Tax=Methylotenera sp. TaxID=2051956 RepID=UPI00271B2D16|nr:ABC-three component system protein [Methylotenera sp.]MDO9204068.1 hypothetical protein [Methylotenera sp.]
MFKLKVYESNGFAYEHLFGQVMQYSRPSFIKIEPYGNQGDRGNDGYEKAEGRYFQVFAPKDVNKSIQAAVKKVAEDFEDKLIPYWGELCEVREYVFVLNDKYHGSNFPIENTLATLKEKHNLAEASLYTSSHLEDEFLKLASDQIMMIVGGLPDENSSEGLDYSVVAEVMKHIQDSPVTNSNFGKLVVPDIDEKITFNGLTTSGHWLKAKQLETWQIDDYFSKNSNFAKQDLRNHLSQLYAECLVNYPEIEGEKNKDLGDIRFTAILEKIAPKTDVPQHDRLRRDVGLVIMAKYFETCDIFEEPK